MGRPVLTICFGSVKICAFSAVNQYFVHILSLVTDNNPS